MRKMDKYDDAETAILAFFVDVENGTNLDRFDGLCRLAALVGACQDRMIEEGALGSELWGAVLAEERAG